MQFRILYQDDRLVAIDKPAGFHVHPPEDARHRISRGTNCLFLLRRQIDRYLYPVHRIDGATSGVLVFALDSDSASNIQAQFRNHDVRKTYFAIVRGWVGTEGLIDSPLAGAESRTRYQRLATVELPHPVGRYETARFSLVQASPETGRMHQIRRHFAHIRHPLIGDSLYGDGKQNRFFRERITELGENRLFLKAHAIRLKHPATGEPLEIRARWDHSWHRSFDLFGVCPLTRFS